MKTIIAGSRTLDNYLHVTTAMTMCPWRDEITEVVSGRALGVDRLGERWADEHGIPVKPFPVTTYEWRTLGRKAGPLRNQKMADYADALVAIHDGHSHGTQDMIDRAKEKGLRIFVLTVDTTEQA